jgi:hypothetical protein
MGVTALASRRADCSSFQHVTVTPAASTLTITVTPDAVSVTNTVVESSTQVVTPMPYSTTTIFQGTADMKKRQATVSPSAVPPYASACSGTVRYASACSCFGITKSTVTAAQPTSYVIVTATASTVTKSTTVTSGVMMSTAPAPLATATITPGDRPVCGSTIQGQGPCGCSYTVSCDQKYSGGRIIATLNLLSEMDCVNACDRYDNCFNVDYSRTTGECNVYQRADTSVTVVDDDAFAFAGICPNYGGSPQCVEG